MFCFDVKSLKLIKKYLTCEGRKFHLLLVFLKINIGNHYFGN